MAKKRKQKGSPGAPEATPVAEVVSHGPPTRSIAIASAVALLLAGSVWWFSSRSPGEAPAPAAGPGQAYSDDFERDSLGSDWLATNSNAVHLEKGALVIEGALNRPLWLQKPIPENAVIEFDAQTEDPVGDIKVEAWGDGHSAYSGDPKLAYTASGYVFIFGGWGNSESIIATRHEHAPNRPSRKDFKVQPGHRYHFRIDRHGGNIVWSLDGKSFLTLNEPTPLLGPTQRYFGFSGWRTRVMFDNLKITPN